MAMTVPQRVEIAADRHRAEADLLMAPGRIQVRSGHILSQYAGHCSQSSVTLFFAIACSNAEPCLALSQTRQLLFGRWSLW